MSSPAMSVVPFAPPEIGAGEIAEVVATLESGWLSTGPRVHQFEQAFAAYVGAPHAIALNSCTAGLHLALLAAGIGPGDEVITSPLTFCATANVVLHAGATPVFADVDPDTGNLDPSAAEAAITTRTRAIMPVHYGGLPADVGAFAALAARHGLTTVEDAAHCVEGIAAGRKIGTTADYTCFSFYATKNLTTGEGGMVTTASAEGAERIRIASLHGMTRDAWTRYQRPGRVAYDVVTPGFKYNMTDLQAALGLHQLRAIDRHYARRQEICAQYDEAFADLPIGRFVDPPAGTRHARHLYTVLVDTWPASFDAASNAAPGAARDAVADALSQAGVSTSVHFPPLHLTKYYATRFGYRRGQFPHAERLTDTLLSLPLSPAHTSEQIAAVTRAVRGIYRASAR